MLEFKYKDVIVGNYDYYGGSAGRFFYWTKPAPPHQLWIFKSRKDYDHNDTRVYYLEDYIENLGNPTPTELSLFELNTGIRLII